MADRRNLYVIRAGNRICFLYSLNSILPLVFSVWLVTSSNCSQLLILEILKWTSISLFFITLNIPLIKSCQISYESFPIFFLSGCPASTLVQVPVFGVTSSLASPGWGSTPCPHICYTGARFIFLIDMIIPLHSENLSWFLSTLELNSNSSVLNAEPLITQSLIFLSKLMCNRFSHTYPVLRSSVS